jgi:hypothetical protein
MLGLCRICEPYKKLLIINVACQVRILSKYEDKTIYVNTNLNHLIKCVMPQKLNLGRN